MGGYMFFFFNNFKDTPNRTFRFIICLFVSLQLSYPHIFLKSVMEDQPIQHQT